MDINAFARSFLTPAEIKAPTTVTIVGDGQLATTKFGEKLNLPITMPDNTARVLRISKTMCRVLIEGFGSADTKLWLGRKIVVTVKEMMIQGNPKPVQVLYLQPVAVGV